MSVRAAATIGLFLLFLLPSAGLAQDVPEYATVEFTPLITDEADYPAFGFFDILEVAVGEWFDPGYNDSIVFRLTVRDWDDQPDAADRFHVIFFTTDVAHSAGIGADARPHDGFQSPIGFHSCYRDGNSVYCTVPESEMGVGRGGSVTQTYAFSQIQYPLVSNLGQDRAPGNSVVSGYGSDYAVQGASKPGPAPGAAPPTTDDGSSSGPHQVASTAPTGDDGGGGTPGPGLAPAMIGLLAVALLLGRLRGRRGSAFP